MTTGVSIVVCTHNGATRLPRVIEHLARQAVPSDIPWEVVLVDNASTDGTSDIARNAWREVSSAPFRVVVEPRLGLSFARRCGIAAANYGIVSFVDDDNWVDPAWVRTVHEVMVTHPEIGACGGQTEAALEGGSPPWFDSFRDRYAVGPQSALAGDITDSRGWLWGAGLSLRRSAYMHLLERGFRPLLSGRSGTRLTTGEDVELCYALRLAGWRLWYDPRLRMQHFMPAMRLNWRYLRKLARANGAAEVAYAAYRPVLGRAPQAREISFRESWPWLVQGTLRTLFGPSRQLLLRVLRADCEGSVDALYLEARIGWLFELMRQRNAYHRNILAVRDAPWRRDQLQA